MPSPSEGIEGRGIGTGIIPIKLTTTFAKGNVNAFILPESPITLVDSGTHLPDSVQQLRRGMEAAGFSFRDVEQIVVTHMHTDHYGGVSAILKETDAPVYVHKQAKRMLTEGLQEFEQGEAFMQAFIEACGASHVLKRNRKYHPEAWKEVRYVEDGDTLQAGGREWKVIYTPGHSQSDICLWDPMSGDTLAGDFLLKEISSNAFIAPPDLPHSERPKPLLQMRNSFRRVYDLPFGTIYPGHGDPFIGHRRLIDQRLEEQKTRCEMILRLLTEEPRTVFGISSALFPWLKESAMFLGLSEVQGHVDLLLSRSLVETERRGSIVWYRAVQEERRG